MLFRRFLTDAKKALNKETPTGRLSRIWTALQEWQYNPATNEITVSTLTRIFPVPASSSLATFEDFDPLTSLGADVDYLLLWRTLISNGGVLIVGPNPDIVSYAVFAVISLVSPLQYREPVLAYTRLGDPRFADVVNGSTFWKIVGTTNILVLERCQQFRMILRLSVDVYPSELKVRKLLQYRTRRFLKRLKTELNDMLDVDPYSDLLGAPIPEESFDWIVSDARSRCLTAKEGASFQGTMTFAFWRTSITMRSEFRESFLSFMPMEVVSDRALDELAAMEAALKGIADRFPSDGHLMAVVKRHTHLIRQERRKQMRELEELTS
jgi:hypothetical protein